MNTFPHWVQVLILTAGELAFALVALPLYVFLVLPKYGAGTLPGFSPLISEGVNSFLVVVLGALVVAVGVGVALLFIRVFGKEKVITQEIATLAANYSMLDFVFIYAAAGFAEEFLFRVVCTDLLGLVVSSILFTAVHIAYWKQPLLLVDVFILALLLGAFYLFTQSLLLCAAAHFVYNLAITYLAKTRFQLG